MEALMEKLFGEGSTYKPKFTLAKPLAEIQKAAADAKPTSATKRAKVSSELTEECFKALLHPHILDFLAPHELLSFWQSCSTCWKNVPSGRKKKAVMLPCVFEYFRISEEAAQQVDQKKCGGWNAFLPVFLQVSQQLAKYYHHLEPDPTHRAFVGEQVCFHRKEHSCLAGKLACYELVTFGELDLDPDVSNYDDNCTKEPTPTPISQMYGGDQCVLDSLSWGEPNTHHNDDNHSCTRNRAWVKAHVAEAPHVHYQERIANDLYPLIPLGEILDTEGGIQEYSLGIGPELEQFVVCECTEDYGGNVEEASFHYCKSVDDALLEKKGGMIEYLMGFPCAHRDEDDREEYDEWEPKPTLGIAIWAMRHSLEPLTDPTIDWPAVISAFCDQLVQEHGAGKEDLVSFYTEALTSPLYGPADKKKWGKVLMESLCPTTIQWYQNPNGEENGPFEDLAWSSFSETLSSLDNAFVYLDAEWCQSKQKKKEVMDNLWEVVHSNIDVQKLFPNAIIIRMKYSEWYPQHTAFKKWWLGQFPNKTVILEYAYGGYSQMPHLMHVQRGKITSIFQDLIFGPSYDSPPPDIARHLRILYLFSFGSQDQPFEERLKRKEDSGDSQSDWVIRRILRRDNRLVQVSPHKSTSATIPILEPIAALHRDGRHFVGHRCPEGGLLECFDVFPPTR